MQQNLEVLGSIHRYHPPLEVAVSWGLRIRQGKIGLEAVRRSVSCYKAGHAVSKVTCHTVAILAKELHIAGRFAACPSGRQSTICAGIGKRSGMRRELKSFSYRQESYISSTFLRSSSCAPLAALPRGHISWHVFNCLLINKRRYVRNHCFCQISEILGAKASESG